MTDPCLLSATAQYICGYTAYLEAISIWEPRTYSVVVTRDPLNILSYDVVLNLLPLSYTPFIINGSGLGQIQYFLNTN